MPEETNNIEGDPQENGGQGKYNPTSLDEALKIIEALDKRVADRDDELSGVKSKVSTLSEQMQTLQDAQKARLETSGNYEELARQRAAEIEALSPYKDRASSLEAVIREQNEKLVQSIPEGMRGIVPTDYPPEKLSMWLTNNRTLLTKAPAPNYDAGANGGTPPANPKLTAEQKRTAAAFGLSEADMLAEIEKDSSS